MLTLDSPLGKERRNRTPNEDNSVKLTIKKEISLITFQYVFVLRKLEPIYQAMTFEMERRN